MSKLVVESLDEHLNEGKLSKALATAGLAGALAFSPMAKAQGQNIKKDKKGIQTEITQSQNSLTPILKGVTSVKKLGDKKYEIEVESRSQNMNFLRSIATNLAAGEALDQEGVEESNISKEITDIKVFKDGSTYLGKVTVLVILK